MQVPEGLRSGFSIGLDSFSLSSSFSPPNHFHSPEAHAFVVSKYSQEISLGRVSLGFDPSLAFDLFGHFCTAPLNVISSVGGKLCVTLDLSFSRNDPSIPSINSLMDASIFKCNWGTFAAYWLLVADAPPGMQVTVFDVDAAFQNIPTKPHDWPLLAVTIDGLIHFDFCLNFGVSTAPGVFGLVADAIVQLFLHAGVDAVLKWVDDFIFFRYPVSTLEPFSYSYDESLIWSVAAGLGWPWAKDKHFPFVDSFSYIGFLWSLARKTVELPHQKRIKYLDKLSDWRPGASISLCFTKSLIGTLNHVCLVVPEGHSHLPSLYAFRAGFPCNAHPFLCHRVETTILTDIQWWRSKLSDGWCGQHILKPPDPLPCSLFVDASMSWGIGLVLDNRWLAWKLKAGWKRDGRDIGWVEMVAVDLAIHTLVSLSFEHCHVILRSDNTGVVGALSAGQSCNSEQNLVLQHIVDEFQCHHIWLTVTWVPSEANLADGPSQGLFPDCHTLYPFPPPVPQYLHPFVHNSVQFDKA